MKQIRASPGLGRISRLINTTEFPSTRTLLAHLLFLYRPNDAQEIAIVLFVLKRLNYYPRLIVCIHIYMFCTWAN